VKHLLTDKQQAVSLLRNLWPKVTEALDAGKELVLEIKAANKSRDQEEKYHAMIGEIAQQAQHLGSKWDAESWKRLLVDQFCKDIGLKTGVVIPNLSGDGIVQLGYQTRKFTKEQASQFVEWLYAWSAENGVLHETDE
jgi:NinB protein